MILIQIIGQSSVLIALIGWSAISLGRGFGECDIGIYVYGKRIKTGNYLSFSYKANHFAQQSSGI